MKNEMQYTHYLKLDDLSGIRIDAGPLLVANESAAILLAFNRHNHVRLRRIAVQTDCYVIV